MARTYGRVKAEVWHDNDWRDLTPLAQWLYVMLLSQAKLNLAGCIDLKPNLWADMARGVTVDDVMGWLEELEKAHMVAVDHHTGELVIRTFTTHDDVFKNRNLGRGVWAAWAGIQSDELRVVVVENMPDVAWDLQYEAPIQARHIRYREAHQ